jgi:hypothetical protein
MKRILKFNESSGSEEMTFEIFKNIMLEVLDDFDYEYNFEIDEDELFVCSLLLRYDEPALKRYNDYIGIVNTISDKLNYDAEIVNEEFISKFNDILEYTFGLLKSLKSEIDKKIKDHQNFINFLSILENSVKTRIDMYDGILKIGKTYDAGELIVNIFYYPND